MNNYFYKEVRGVNLRLIIASVIMIFILSGCFNNNKKEHTAIKENQQANQENLEQEENDSKSIDEVEEGNIEEEKVVNNDQKNVGEKQIKEEIMGENKTGELKNNTQKKTVSVIESGTESDSAPALEGETKTDVPDTNSITITEVSITQKYKQELLNLQGYYSSKLINLSNSSINELKGTTGSKSELYSKYSGIGMALKEESEAKVNQTLYQMEKELKANSFPTDSVSEFRQSYYSEMDRASSNAINNIKAALGK
jgi:uncharacterized protein YneF (UPF0154 family)